MNVVMVKLWGMIDMVSNAIGKFREFAVEMKIDEQLIDSIESDFVRV